MKHHILIVCALSFEMKEVKKHVKNLNIPDIKISFLITGVGNYNMIFELQNYVHQKWLPDFICNIWMCWKKDDKVISKPIQLYRIKNAANGREVICPIYSEIFPLESICCSERVITDSIDMWEEKYVDMESYWVDYVATKNTIPYICIKLPFDTVSQESKKLNIAQMQQGLSHIDYSKILEYISTYLSSHNNLDIDSAWDLEFYKKYFKFSFAENLIFIKNYNKFIAFDKNFEDFFEDNKGLDKKEFLRKFGKMTMLPNSIENQKPLPILPLQERWKPTE